MSVMKIFFLITQPIRSPFNMSCLSDSSCSTPLKVGKIWLKSEETKVNFIFVYFTLKCFTFHFLYSESINISTAEQWCFLCMLPVEQVCHITNCVALNKQCAVCNWYSLCPVWQCPPSFPETRWRRGRRRTTPGWSCLTCTARPRRASVSPSSLSTWAWG